MKTKHNEEKQLAVDSNLQANDEEAIAKRAYKLWQQRNCEHGNDLADWFQAERELNE